MTRRIVFTLVVIACFWMVWNTPSFAQDLGKMVSDGKSVSGHAAVNGHAGVAAAGAALPMWPGFFIFNGVRYNFTMVGSDPTVAGAGTTNVPVVIIPLSFNIGGTVISPIAAACGDNTSVLTRIQGSPLFTTNVTWVEGNTTVGVTQFTDAFQRANFWKYVSTVSPNYHVLLNPISTTAVIQVNVPAGQGSTTNNTACPQQPIGTVNMAFLDQTLRNLIAQLGIGPGTLPLFVAYDMVGLPAGGGFFFGYHTAYQPIAGGPFQTYSFGSYTDSGLLGQNVADISILSHELGEWMDDPVNNPAPPWGHIGQVTGCQANIEVGDPLTGSNSTVFTPGFNYHVQDLAFFSWFARQQPSIAVNGWYSTLNAFASPPPVCS